MNKETSSEIINILRTLIPSPVCELNFSSLYELVAAVLLSSQTTDKRVNMITPALFSKYPNPESLMNAEYEDVYDIIKSLGFAHNKALNLISMAKTLHNDFHDEVPKTLDELQKLSGVGRKTASVVLAVGYKIPAMPVDTHLQRVGVRLGYAKKNDNVLEIEKKYCKYIPKEDWIEAHHLLLLFGRYHCKAINPICNSCLLKKYCKVDI